MDLRAIETNGAYSGIHVRSPSFNCSYFEWFPNRRIVAIVNNPRRYISLRICIKLSAVMARIIRIIWKTMVLSLGRNCWLSVSCVLRSEPTFKQIKISRWINLVDSRSKVPVYLWCS